MLVILSNNNNIVCNDMYSSDKDDVSDTQPTATVIGRSTYVRWGRITCGNNSQLS